MTIKHVSTLFGYLHAWISLPLPPPLPPHTRMHRGEVAALFKHHSAPITSVEWHPQDSTVFASSGADDQVRACTQLAFHPTGEGEYIASSSEAKYEASRRTHTAVIPPRGRKREELHAPGLFYLSVLRVRKSLRRTHVSVTSPSCSLEQIIS